MGYIDLNVNRSTNCVNRGLLRTHTTYHSKNTYTVTDLGKELLEDYGLTKVSDLPKFLSSLGRPIPEDKVISALESELSEVKSALSEVKELLKLAHEKINFIESKF